MVSKRNCKTNDGDCELLLIFTFKVSIASCLIFCMIAFSHLMLVMHLFVQPSVTAYLLQRVPFNACDASVRAAVSGSSPAAARAL